MLSVLMSIYKDELPLYFRDCLSSLSSQTVKADEVVIVEDGPIPTELHDIIEEYRVQLNIISVQLRGNKGLAKALNEGLQHCKHDLVARMDTDDIALPDRFEKQIFVFNQNSQLDILGGFAEELGSKGKKGVLRIMPINHEDIVSNLYLSPFIHPTVMYRKESILSVGGYNESLTRRQDYELWFRCASANFTFRNLSESILLYRFTPETHKRQSREMLFKQGIIGMKGVRLLQQPLWKGMVSFVPFLRSLFPQFMQHYIYKVLKKIDPRQNVERSR